MDKQILHLKNDKIRFIIISVLLEPLRSEITEISEEFYNMSGSQMALTYPPHITLRTGAIVPVSEIDSYIEGFKKTIEVFKNKNLEKSSIAISTPGWIDYLENGINKHLILYFIQESPWLIELNKTLLEYTDFIKSNKTVFNPHISLAYDDLDDENFEKLKIYIIQNKQKFKKDTAFYINEVSLYFQDVDGYWKEYFTVRI